MNQSRAKALRREVRKKGLIDRSDSRTYRRIPHKSSKYAFLNRDGEVVEPWIHHFEAEGPREVYQQMKKVYKARKRQTGKAK